MDVWFFNVGYDNHLSSEDDNGANTFRLTINFSRSYQSRTATVTAASDGTI